MGLSSVTPPDYIYVHTIVGGAVPDNMFLILLGAATVDNGLSLGVLIIVSVCGGFAGYEINYWSGRLLGYTTCKRGCPAVLKRQKCQQRDCSHE